MHTPGNGWWYKQISVDVGGVGPGDCQAKVTVLNRAPYQVAVVASGPTTMMFTLAPGGQTTEQAPDGHYDVAVFPSDSDVASSSLSWDISDCGDYQFTVDTGA